MSLIKGIKKDKTIELLEEINIPDGQEILVDIQTVNNFWTSLENLVLPNLLCKSYKYFGLILRDR